MTILALAWCLKYDKISSVVIGASKVEHLENYLKAFEVSNSLNEDVS